MAAKKESARGSSAKKNQLTALQSLSAELQAVEEADLIHINIDVMATVATALGILPKLEKLHAELRKLPKLDLAKVDGFEDYAMALYEAQLDYLAATQPPESLPELAAQGTALRDRLFSDVQGLIGRDVIDAKELREVKTGTGYKALATDLGLLADAVQQRWEELKGKTLIQREELLQAKNISMSLLRGVGEKEQAPVVAAEASARRARAFTLFMRAYDEVRRAVSYLRWEEGDAELIAPSLYPARNNGRKKPEPEQPEVPVVAPVPVKPSTPAGEVGTPTSNPYVDDN